MIAPAIKQNMKSTFPKAIFLSALLISAPVLSIAQSVVYDNTSTNFQATSGGRPFVYAPATKTAEFGDQITLATSPNRNASLFQFYYYYNGAASDLPTATVRFYSGAPSASSLFYTSDAIPLSGRDTRRPDLDCAVCEFGRQYGQPSSFRPSHGRFEFQRFLGEQRHLANDADHRIGPRSE